jgi:PAS domain S-box-containing protein
MSQVVDHLPRAASTTYKAPPWSAVVESLPHVMWLSAPDGTPLFVNRRGFEIAGLDPERASELGWLQVVHPEDVRRAKADCILATSSGTRSEGEYRFRTVDGTYRWMLVRTVPVPGPNGTIDGWVGTWSDIDDLKRLHEELRDANRRSADALAALEALQSTAPIGIGMVDPCYRVVHLNDILGELNGINGSEVIGQLLPDILGERWAVVRPFFDQVLTAGEPILNIEVQRRTAAGDMSDWIASYYPVRAGGELIGVGVVALDITERKADKEFLSVVMDHMAEGLYALDGEDRVTYMNAAASKMLGWRPEELLGKSMHDIVHFQRLDGTPLPASHCPLIRVRSEGQPVRVSNDAFTRKDGSVFPAAYSSAPLRGRSTGNGAVVVFRDSTEDNNERARVEQELAALSWVGRIRDALDEERLVLHSQPIISAHGGDANEELLLRMVTRDGELITPATFLPVAERYGLIQEIDRWVITQAIRRAATGQKVEMNLSGASVASPDIYDLIERELRESGADPSNVVFEITETALIGDMTAGEAFAHRIVGLGCQLALDDFGTGYGSFTYLKRLPIRLLKIDIEFVRDILDNAANQHVVRAIISLARAFNLKTVAEGIEDEATWQYLRNEGVDFGQGYHLGRPAPMEPVDHTSDDEAAGRLQSVDG